MLTQPQVIAKLCAVWLVTLILLPFTAPFATFDVSGLPGHAVHHNLPRSPRHRSESAITLSNDALPVVPVSETRRAQIRLLALSQLLAADLASSPSTIAPPPIIAPAPITPPPAFVTILRL